SRATAVSEWPPLVEPVVDHDAEYGAVVSSAPRFAPSSLNWTPTTPTLSEAFAVTDTVPDTVVPPAGAGIDTVRFVVSPFDPVTGTPAAAVVSPAASRATAVNVWPPAAADVVFHDIEYGKAVYSAPRFAPSSLNWTPATPTLSEAFAVTFTVPLTVLPAAGVINETVGFVVSLLLIVTVTPADVPRFPAASRATAVSTCVPLDAVAVFHDTE